MNKKILLTIAASLIAFASSATAATFTVNTDYAITNGGEGSPGNINISGTVTTDGANAVTGINLTFSSPAKNDISVTTIGLATGTAQELVAGTLTFDGGNFNFSGSNSSLAFADGFNLLISHHDGADSNTANQHAVGGAGSFTMTVVPEPHEYAMMAGLGLLGFGVWRRKSMKMA